MRLTRCRPSLWFVLALLAGGSAHGDDGALPPLAARTGPCAAVVGSRIVVLGGWDETKCGATDQVDVLEPGASAWRAGPALGVPRAMFAVAVLDGRLYALGGVGARAGDSTPRQVERWNPATDAWERLADLPLAHTRFAAVAHQGRLWAIGGHAPGVGDRADVNVYDPRTRAWTSGPPLPYAEHGHDAVVLEGRIHVLGGLNEGTAHVALSPAGTWERRAPLPSGRVFTRAAAVGGKLFVVAGASNDAPDSTAVQAYDPAANAWTQVAPSPVRRYRHALVVLGDVIVVLGGDRASPRVDRYLPGLDRWE